MHAVGSGHIAVLRPGPDAGPALSAVESSTSLLEHQSYRDGAGVVADFKGQAEKLSYRLSQVTSAWGNLDDRHNWLCTWWLQV